MKFTMFLHFNATQHITTMLIIMFDVEVVVFEP